MIKILFNAIISLLFLLVAAGFSRQPDLPIQQEPMLVDFSYKGSFECSRCHTKASIGDVANRVTDFVSMTEYRNWLNRDPHVTAYLSIIPDREHFNMVRAELNRISEQANEQLAGRAIPDWEENSNQRSANILTRVCGCTQSEISQLFQRMTLQPDLLTQPDGLPDFPPRLVATVKQCMSCHAGWDLRRDEFDFEVVKFGTGVSCEACHGPSSNWLAQHAQPEWRQKNPQEKADSFGLNNLRQPVTKSRQCFSCHIGDVDQGRVVTHAMYAAGHPPLPGIEIESYADQIPRHWRYLPEKTDEFKFASEFRTQAAANLGLENEIQLKQDYPRTKNLLVNGVMASARSVDLLADSAGEYLKLQKGMALEQGSISTARRELNPWPEFAAFDCAACHHDLKTSGRERAFAGVPGRPPKPAWPGTLAKLGLAWLDLKKPGRISDEFETSQTGLQNALNRQPFGQPEELNSAGKNHSGILSGIAEQIQGTPLNREDAIEILQLLCGARQVDGFNPKDEIRDFHSARQLGWAIRLVYSEIASPAVVGEIRLSDQFQSPDSEIADAMNELQEYLMLDLAPTGEITPLQQKFLNTWRNFDRSQFFELIDRFSVALKNSKLASETNLQPTTR